jgi:ABC-type nitrate/sulfonate/bicarbonate transport system permease component
MRRVFWASRAPGVLLIGIALVFWEFSARSGLVDSPNFPPVSEILNTGWGLVTDGLLIENTVDTLRRMLLGYSIAAVVGVTLGIVMGYYRPIYNLLEPTIELLRPIPAPAYLPVLILFLGIDDLMKVTLIVVAAFFPIVLNTYAGVRSIDPVLMGTARTFGLSNRSALREIVLPAASPAIFTGLRISLAISLILAILSEMVASTNGLGFLILEAQRTFRAPMMYVALFTLAILGYLLNWTFLRIERRVLRWHVESTRLEV